MISDVGKYSGLFLALLLLNLTALADDLTSLSFESEPGYYAAQNNVRSGGMGEMIADNELSFSNSVPGHHEKNQYNHIIIAGVKHSQSRLKYNCPTVCKFNNRVNVLTGYLSQSLVFNNSPPVFN